MTSETDAEFLDRMEQTTSWREIHDKSERDHLFALARRGAAADAEIERLRAALREIVAMDEVALVEFKKGDGWLHQRVARAALEGE